MPTVTPTGRLSLVLENLKVLFGDCPTLQAVIATNGTALQTDAAFQTALAQGQADPSVQRAATQARIRKWWVDNTPRNDGSDTMPMPRVIIRYDRYRLRQHGRNSWGGTGSMYGYFEFPTPTVFMAADYENAGNDFTNKLGAIKEEAMALAADYSKTSPLGTTYLSLTVLELDDIGQGNPQDNNGIAFWGAYYELRWQGM